eukprot:s2498_g4.t1
MLKRRVGCDADLVVPADAAERKKAKAVIAYRVDLLPQVDSAHWLTSLAIDAQRARIAILPHTADAPIVMQTLVLISACLMKWVFMEGTPVAGVCPHLVLLARTLDRVAIPTYGAQILSDTAYLERPSDLSPAILANEMEQVRGDLHGLTQPLLLWRRRAPEHLCSAFDRITMAVLQACEEFLYFEAAPLLSMLNEHLTRLQDLMTHAHLHAAPAPPTPRISVTPRRPTVFLPEPWWMTVMMMPWKQ